MSRLRRRVYIPIIILAAVVIIAIIAARVVTGRRLPAALTTPTAQPMPTATAAPAASPTPQPVAARSRVVVLSAWPVNTLDPYLMTTVIPEQSIAAHIWEPLVGLNHDLQLEPRLAESWELINDFTWEFKLRQGVLFHNGEPFNAQAVKFSLERAQTLAGSLETFADDVDLGQVEIVDDYTLRMHIAHPLANLAYELVSLEMLPPGYYGIASSEDIAGRPIGSGPYRFDSWDAERDVMLTANPNYWGGAPLIETLVFGAAADAEQRLAALESGQADIISDIPPTQFGKAETANSRGAAVESTRRLLVGIRGDPATPLADVRVRQALNYALDVDAIVQATQAGYGQRYASYVNPPNADPTLSPWPYDPARARELLAEAGYPDGFETAMDVPIDRYPNSKAIAEAIAQDLAQVGVQVELRYRAWPEFVQELLDKQSSPLFLLAMNSRGNDLEDARNLAFLFPFNPTGWYNSEFEALLLEAGSTYNREKRQNLLWKAQEIAYQEAPWIFLWHLYDFYGVNRELTWSPRSDALIDLYQSPASR